MSKEIEDSIELRVIARFIQSLQKVFKIGDKVRVVEEGYKPLGIFGKEGMVISVEGRGYYGVKLIDGQVFKFFSGDGWSEIEKIEGGSGANLS